PPRADHVDLHEVRRDRELPGVHPSGYPVDGRLGQPQRPSGQSRGLQASGPAAGSPAPQSHGMIAAGIGLALLSAVIHGTWNIMVKVSGDPMANFQRATVAAWLVITLPVVSARI